MARNKTNISKAQPTFPSLDVFDIGDIFENVSLNKRMMRGKHVAIKAIRLLPGRLEADYEINGGKASTSGTLLIRNDEHLAKITEDLSAYIVQTYKQFEKMA